jgi:hypothetical protein
MEKETLEEGLLQHIKFCLECKNESQAIRLIEKYGFEKQEQDKNKSSEGVICKHCKKTISVEHINSHLFMVIKNGGLIHWNCETI